MSLTSGRGPLSNRPAGRFTAPVPEGVAYLEPMRRRVRALKGADTVVDSERALLVHRPGQPPGYALPEADVHGVPSEPDPDAPGHVRVAWDAADAWLEEDEPVIGHPRNPYHRVDSLRSHRRLRVEAAGITLVDTDQTTAVFETALEPRLYVDPQFRADGPADPERHSHLLPVQRDRDLLDGTHRRCASRGCRVELRGASS